MNKSWLGKILMIPRHEPMTLSVTNSLELWMTWTTPNRELKAQDAMNNSKLCMTWTTLGHGLKTLDAMNNSWWWMTWTILGHELKALDTMNSSRLLLAWATLGYDLRVMNLWTTWSYAWYEWPEVLWPQFYRCYEQLRVVDNINDFASWAQVTRCY